MFFFPFTIHFCFWCGKYYFSISAIEQCSKKVAFISSFRRDLIKNFAFGGGLIIKAFWRIRARKTFLIFFSQLCRDKLRQLIIAFKVESVQKKSKMFNQNFSQGTISLLLQKTKCQFHHHFTRVFFIRKFVSEAFFMYL